jgi:flavin-dependent dehydrogenase
MEYTNVEKQVLSLMKKTDFKNLSKNDVLSYASKLNELRPEVAQQVLAQFPQLVKLIQSSMVEYKEILEKIIASDDDSTNQVYGILNKEIESSHESRKEYIIFADKVRSDLSKCLDNPNLTPEQQKEIIDREMEIFHMVDKKDAEIREQEMEIARMADKKDTEKKEFNWKILGTASLVILTAVGIGTAALGGKLDIKLPKKL